MINSKSLRCIHSVVAKVSLSDQYEDGLQHSLVFRHTERFKPHSYFLFISISLSFACSTSISPSTESAFNYQRPGKLGLRSEFLVPQKKSCFQKGTSSGVFSKLRKNTFCFSKYTLINIHSRGKVSLFRKKKGVSFYLYVSSAIQYPMLRNIFLADLQFVFKRNPLTPPRCKKEYTYFTHVGGNTLSFTLKKCTRIVRSLPCPSKHEF